MENKSEYNFLAEQQASEDDYLPPSAKVFKLKTRKATTKKPKVVADWTDDEVSKLIVCVECRPPLWNAGDAKYKNRTERTKLWDEISENEFECKFDGAQLLAKWTNIRIQYRCYSMKKTKSGQEAEAPISWKFFSSMSFVGRAEHEQTALTESNLANFNEGSSSLPDSIDLSEKTPKSVRKTPSVCSGASTSSQSAANVIAQSMKEAALTLQQSKKSADEFDTFAMYLASELRALDDIAMARRIKLKLNRCFLDTVELEQERKQQQNTQILYVNSFDMMNKNQ